MFSLILTGILLKGEPPDHQHMNIISKDNAGFLKFSVKHAGVQETMTLCRKTPRCACQATLVRAVYFSCRVIWMLVFVHIHLQSFLPSCFTWALAGMWEARVFSASQWWGWHLHFCVLFSVSWSGGCKIETSVHSSCMLRHFIKQMPFRSKVLHCTRNINDSVRIHMQIQLQSAAAFLKIKLKEDVSSCKLRLRYATHRPVLQNSAFESPESFNCFVFAWCLIGFCLCVCVWCSAHGQTVHKKAEIYSFLLSLPFWTC